LEQLFGIEKQGTTWNRQSAGNLKAKNLNNNLSFHI